MNSSTSEFVTVDMRGLKGALVACARQRRVAVSVVVRDAVTRALDVKATTDEVDGFFVRRDLGLVKISLRMTSAEVNRLDAAALQAGLSRPAFLVGLLDGVQVLSSGGRKDHLAALVASNDSVATLSRNINHLVRLLRESSVRAAQEYREMLETLNDDVRRHLGLASSLLDVLQPRAASYARRASVAKES